MSGQHGYLADCLPELRLGGTSGDAGSDAGSGATLPVSGIDIPLPETSWKLEFGILVTFGKYLAPIDDF